MARHVALVGLMGAGKTTVGERVARRLGRSFRDSDGDLRLLLGVSAADYATEHGLDALHEHESAVLLDALSSEEPLVVSAAASTIEVALCRAALATAFVVWLTADPAVLATRAEGGAHRPLEDDAVEQLRALASQRDPLFEAVADVQFDVADFDPEAIATRVLDAL